MATLVPISGDKAAGRQEDKKKLPETGLEPARAWLAHQPLKLCVCQFRHSGAGANLTGCEVIQSTIEGRDVKRRGGCSVGEWWTRLPEGLS